MLVGLGECTAFVLRVHFRLRLGHIVDTEVLGRQVIRTVGLAEDVSQDEMVPSTNEQRLSAFGIVAFAGFGFEFLYRLQRLIGYGDILIAVHPNIIRTVLLAVGGDIVPSEVLVVHKRERHHGNDLTGIVRSVIIHTVIGHRFTKRSNIGHLITVDQQQVHFLARVDLGTIVRVLVQEITTAQQEGDNCEGNKYIRLFHNLVLSFLL